MSPTVLALLVAASGALPAVVAAQEPPPGMAVYHVVLLRPPQAAAVASPDDPRVFSEQRARMDELVARGVLAGGGPVSGADDLRAVYILRAGSDDEARHIADEDPAVKAGRLTAQVLRWWAWAGLGEEYAARRKADPAAQPETITYQLGLLARGPKWTAEQTPEVEAIQKGHMDNIRAMASAGALVAAGPFVEGGDLRGIFVFRLASVEAARQLADRDPAVQAGRLVLKLSTWFVADGVFPAPQAPKP